MMDSCCNCDCHKKIFRLNKVSSCPDCRGGSSVQSPVPSNFTSGAIWRNPETKKIVVSLLNKSDIARTVTVSVVDWQNCAQAEMSKEAFLCGESQPSLFNGTPTPLTFTIPAKKLLVVHATPQNIWLPNDPIYEVLVNSPGDPVLPPDPVIFNTWGINDAGVPQEGNTVLHQQFLRTFFV